MKEYRAVVDATNESHDFPRLLVDGKVIVDFGEAQTKEEWLHLAMIRLTACGLLN